MHNKTIKQTESHNGSNNQQQTNNNRTIASEWTAVETTGGGGGGGGEGLNAFYCNQIFALDSVVVKAQKMLSSHGGFLFIAMYMYHYRETI